MEFKMRARVYMFLAALLMFSFAGKILAAESLPPVMVFPDELGEAADIYWSVPKFNANGSPMGDYKGVYIYRSTYQGGPYMKLTSKLYTTKNVRYFRDVNLMNDVSYYYVLQSYDDIGNGSEYSPEQVVTPRGDMRDPERVLNLIAQSKTPGTAELSWDPSFDQSGIVGYRVYRSYTEIQEEYLTGKNYKFKLDQNSQLIFNEKDQKQVDFTTTVKGIGAMFDPIATLPGDATSFIDRSVDNGVTYYYCVTAIDPTKNESLASNSPKVVIKGTRTVAPFIRSVMEDTYDIPKNAGKIISVAIAGESGCQADFSIESVVSMGTTAGKMVETAQPGVYIGYYTVKPGDNGVVLVVKSRLRAKVDGRVSKLATVLEASTGTITLDTIAPSPVTQLNAKAQLSPRVALFWHTPAVVDDVVGFNIYRDRVALTAESSTKVKLNTKLLLTDLRSYVDATGTPNTIYYYGVATVDAAANENIAVCSPVRVLPDLIRPIVSKVYEDTLGIPKREGSRIRFTLLGEPGCVATVKVGSAMLNISLTEMMIGSVRTGTYIGEYFVAKGDDTTKSEVMGELRDPSGNVSEAVSSKYTDNLGRKRGLVTVVTSSSDVTPPHISSVDYKGSRILTKGEVVTVVAEGEAGGTAFFDIGSMKRNILMMEDGREAGYYYGQYTVTSGDNIENTEITVWLADMAGNLASANTTDIVTIDTSVSIVMSHIYQENQMWFDVDSDDILSIKAVVTDARGRELSDRVVDFDLVGGFGEVLDVTGSTVKGVVFTRFDPGAVVETAYVSAEDVETGVVTVCAVRMMKEVTFNMHLTNPNRRLKTQNGSYYLSVRAKPRRITANGEMVCVVTATVRKLAADGEMKFDDDDNSDERIAGEQVDFFILDQPYDDDHKKGFLRIHPDYLNTVTGKALTDERGEAKAIYTAGTKVGTVIFQVVTGALKVGTPIGENCHIEQIAGGVEFLEMYANTDTLEALGASEVARITVKAEDSFNNPVDNVQVQFHIASDATGDVGSIVAEGSSGGLTDEDGRAYATYYAGTRAGLVKIVADVRSQDRIDEAVMLYSLQRYNDAIDAFNVVLNYLAYQEENWTDDMRFMLGYSYELVKDYDNAIEQYDEVVDYYFGGPWLDNALYRKGQTHEKQVRYADALEVYKTIVTDYPRSDLADNALLRIAVMYENLEYFMVAKQMYTKLVLDYPESTLVPTAQMAIDKLDLQGIRH